MKKSILFGLFFMLTSLMYAQSPIGTWKTIDDETKQAKSYVEIFEKDGKLYGKVTKILTKGKEDAKCTDCSGALKNKPILGMQILSGLKKDGKEWNGGKIIDPGGFLVFKWNETDIKLSEILALTSAKPLLGQIMPELLITQLFDQIDAHDPLRHWAEDYLEIKKQQKEKAQLPVAEQAQILKLLENKIEALNLRAIEPTNDIEKLKQYLTEYSFNLKQHFYG